ncbi:MAG: PQQ-binding-like beta-propeller repeat protein [Deltaproteobacteria bacterium]|nr:PQQ-binding-like beta-propeller repeat protein [Deltaproteobacteria bacterium]MBW2531921.1 PQQ-binding-like beta-propeller repeat protein [Deltaproteobacteria bacterium]
MLTSVTFLSFLAGATVVRFQLWPYPTLWRAFMATEAIDARLRPAARYGWFLYGKARREQPGVLRYDPDQAVDGFTVFSSGDSQRVVMVDMAGTIVHQWRKQHSSIWPDPPHVAGGAPDDELVTVRRTKLFPNGDLLALYVCQGKTPWGCGLVKLDRHSRVLWKYPGNTHHDVQLGDDGQIVTLTHEILTEPIPGLPAKLVPPFVEDFVVLLSEDGEPLKKVGVTAAFLRSPYAAAAEQLRPDLTGDLWHANGATPLTRDLAPSFPFLAAGQVLLSLRNVGCLAAMDLEQETIVWARFGPFRRQHDADFLPNGHILLFDNRGPLVAGPRSRVIEIDPRTMGIAWQFDGTAEDRLYSRVQGSQQRLRGGNTLITESQGGRILEVTANGEVVWEYSSPFRAPQDPQKVGIVQRAERIERDAVAFELEPPR